MIRQGKGSADSNLPLPAVVDTGNQDLVSKNQAERHFIFHCASFPLDARSFFLLGAKRALIHTGAPAEVSAGCTIGSGDESGCDVPLWSAVVCCGPLWFTRKTRIPRVALTAVPSWRTPRLPTVATPETLRAFFETSGTSAPGAKTCPAVRRFPKLEPIAISGLTKFAIRMSGTTATFERSTALARVR